MKSISPIKKYCSVESSATSSEIGRSSVFFLFSSLQVSISTTGVCLRCDSIIFSSYSISSQVGISFSQSLSIRSDRKKKFFLSFSLRWFVHIYNLTSLSCITYTTNMPFHESFSFHTLFFSYVVSLCFSSFLTLLISSPTHLIELFHYLKKCKIVWVDWLHDKREND